MLYEIRKPFLGLFGKPRLAYCCESCGVALESPLWEAGSKQKCPQCGHAYVAPGAREAELQREADEKIRAAKALTAVAKAEQAARAASSPPPMPSQRGTVKECFSKIAGVRQLNPDGISRQYTLGKCRVGERLHFIREPNNKHDPNAVKICRRNGVQVGYVTAHLATTIAPAMDAGGQAWAIIKEFTGGTTVEDLTRGANLVVYWTVGSE